MKLRLAMWFFILGLVAAYAADCAATSCQPVLDFASGLPWTRSPATNFIKFWPNPEDAWELQLAAEGLQLFCLIDGVWLPAADNLGGPAGNLSPMVDLHLALEIPWLEPGLYEIPLTFQMPKGNGLVVYQAQSELWLLALGSDLYALKDPAGNVEKLPPGQWSGFDVSFEQASLYWQDSCIWPTKPENEIHDQGFEALDQKDFMWRQGGFSVQSGSEFQVELQVTFCKETQLELVFSQGLIPQWENWTIDNQPLARQKGGDRYFVSFDSAIPGKVYTIRGLVRAGAALEQKQWITATYNGKQATLPGRISPGWFGAQGDVFAQVSLGGQPVPNCGLVLPDGTRATTDSEGCLAFTAEPGLHRIIGCQNPGAVFWFDLGLNEIRRLNLELKPKQMTRGLNIWDIRLDSEVDWAFSMASPDLQVGFKPDHKLTIQYKTDAIAINFFSDLKQEKIALRGNFPRPVYSGVRGNWVWTGSDTRWQARCFLVGAKLTADIHTSGHYPYLAGISLAGEDPYWKIALLDKGLSSELKIGDVLVKAKAKSSLEDFQLELVSPQWTLNLGALEICLKHTAVTGTGDFGWKCRYNPSAGFIMDISISHANYQMSFFTRRQAGVTSAGLKGAVENRRAWGAASANWAFLFSRQNISVATGLHRRLPLASFCHLAVDWQARWNNGALGSSWDVGLVVENPNFAAKVGWDKLHGGYFRAGLSLVEWY